MISDILYRTVGAFFLSLLPSFYLYSPTSRSTKFLITQLLAGYALSTHIGAKIPAGFFSNPLSVKAFIFISTSCVFLIIFRCVQQEVRYRRINSLKKKFGFNNDPASWSNMTVKQAQKVERNMAEWEFPRLFQFAWVSDFLRTSTNPGVSRALVRSGHMVNADPMVEHERLQTTVHLMSAMVAYKFRTDKHSLVVSRINEHHHRYGSWINSDDVLYLIIHFSQSSVHWINRFGYRKLEAFEVQAMWVLWRELACSMGVKYIPETLEQAQEWRKNFESTCRWRDDANEEAGMAMMNELIYMVPSMLKPFARKLIASVLDKDIIYFCRMEKLGPSSTLRSVAYGLFGICAFFIRNFCFSRSTPYKRAPDTSNKSGTWNFGHTPYDTLPFFQEKSFWNLFGYGALLRRIYGIPMASPEFFSDGIAIERMGARHTSATTQVVVEKKVRYNAACLKNAPYGYRPGVGFQAGRLLPPVDGPSYGLEINTFSKDAKATPLIPASAERFDKQYEVRSSGFSDLTIVEKPVDVFAFSESESLLSDFREGSLVLAEEVAAVKKQSRLLKHS